MPRALLSAGSNVGQSLQTLQQAFFELEKEAGSILACSSVYRTKPWGYTAQPDFLNAACLLDTKLTPMELLHTLQQIELLHGRERLVHWGPRTLDLDIIDYEGVCSDSAELTLPHPRALERAFVLVPLAEIVPHYIFASQGPVGLSVEEALSALSKEERDEVLLTDGKLKHN